MSNPPNKTRTHPGLGEGGADAVPRLNSAEMKRVRREAREEAPQSEGTPPPIGMAERPRLRDSVRREEPDDDAPPAVPVPAASTARPADPYGARVRESVRREDPDDPPVAIRPAEAMLRPRVRESVRREDPDDPPAAAVPKVAESVRPRIRDSVRREDPDDTTSTTPSDPRAEQVSLGRPSAMPPRRGSALWSPEKDTGTRTKPATGRSQRPPVTVDEVGATALKIARTTRREGSPKLVASRAIVAKAPIDTRSAFVLSLVDGRNTVDAIVDMAGMPVEEVKGILERLARLGLIQLP